MSLNHELSAMLTGWGYYQVGAGVLGLPQAMAYLEWGGGMVCLALFAAHGFA